MSQYLISEVLCPLFFSLIITILGSNKISKIILFVVTILNIAALVPIYNTLVENGQVIYLLGGYSNTVGIELKLNFYSFIFLAIFNISFLGFNFYKSGNFSYLQNILLLICVSGFNGILMSNDLFNIYVFLELSSIAFYALIASCNNFQAVEAAFRYLVFGTIGAGLYLVGVAFLYMFSGTLNISELMRISTNFTPYSAGFLWLSMFFILLGFVVKLGVFPIHNWLFQIYNDTPSKITMFIAMTSSITSIYILSVFIFNVYDIMTITKHLKISGLLQILGLTSAISCSFLAYKSKSTKETLSYSSLADIGYILNSIGLITDYRHKTAGAMIILQLVNSLISKPVLFLLFAEDTINQLTSKTKKNLHFVITIFFTLSLIGVPPLLGFFGKFKLITYVIQQKNWINLVFVLISTYFSCLYGIKIIKDLEHLIIPEKQTELNHKLYYTSTLPASFVFLALTLSILVFSNQMQIFIDSAIRNLLIQR